jgi:hypothetical protein
MVQTIHPLRFFLLQLSRTQGSALKKCSCRLSVNESCQPPYRSSPPHCERRWNRERLAICRSKRPPELWVSRSGRFRARISRGRGKLRSMLNQYVGSSRECEKQASIQANGSPGRRRKQGLAQNRMLVRDLDPEQTSGQRLDRRRLTASARPGSVVKSLATKVVRPKNQSKGLDVPFEIATTVSLPNVIVQLSGRAAKDRKERQA